MHILTDQNHSEVALLAQRLREAEATIEALLSGEIDAVIDPGSKSLVSLALAQKAVHDSEARYRNIVETANEGICVVDFASIITFANQRLADMLGYPTSEIVGQSLYQFIPLKHRARAEQRLQRASSGEIEESEAPVLQRSGATTWVLIKSKCMRDSSGTATGLLVMITDTSRHRTAELALRGEGEEYRQIVESISDGIVKIDLASVITFANVRFAEMLGYTSSELIGTTLFSVIAPSEHARAMQSIKQREEGVIAEFDTRYLHKSGAEIAVSIAGSPLRDARGELVGVLGVVRDVTDRRKLQAQLIVSDRMASVGALAAGVAHEINNPLSAVIANLEFIDEGV